MATWKTRSMYLLHTDTRSCWTSQAINQLDCVSNERIYHLTNTQPLINTARQPQLRFLGHMLGMPEEEPCRKYAMYVPTHGRRSRTAEDKLPILFTEAFWGCRKWSEPRSNCLISCRSLCLEKICSRLLRSWMNEWMNEWMNKNDKKVQIFFQNFTYKQLNINTDTGFSRKIIN